LTDPPAGSQHDLADAIARLWETRRDGFAARVDRVEAAVLALLDGTLGEPLRAEAEREAHKLGGALGTFGVPGGSELALEIEQRLAADRVATGSAARLAELVLALGREVERGPTTTATSAASTPVVQNGADPAVEDAAEDRDAAILVLTGDPALGERLQDEGAAREMLVEVVADAGEVLKTAERDRPAAAVLDLGHDTPGPPLLGLLESLSRLRPKIPAFALYAGDDLSGRVQLAGFDVTGVLPRGTAPAAVLSFVERALARQATARTRIIALDDDPSIVAALGTLLTPDGVEVVGVEDPESLWEALRGAPPDLIVLDVDMPTLSGFDVCRVLRADPRFQELPVLFLSARTDGESLRRMFEAGADDYVAKPIVASELLGRIRNRMRRARLLRELADQDGLTGIPNRRKVSADLVRLLRLADRYEQPLSIAVVDIDNFKAVNDRNGHAAGDALLRALGTLMLRMFRGEDAIGRWGGEEFMLGMYGARRDAGVRRIEELLRRFRAIELPVRDGAVARATFSAGVAQFPADAGSLNELYRRADTALYAAKTHGRARVVATGWEPPGEARAVDVLVVEDDDALRDLLVHSLLTRGYTTAAIGDGRAAVQALEGADPPLRPRLALLDVDLPGLDGLSVLRRLRRDGILDRLRVIMLTARAAEPEVLEALELGAYDHVAKPFSVPILMQRIEQALGDRS